jgi:Urea amidohydrolase (urease) alpha subunit
MHKNSSVNKSLLPVKNIRNISKKDMILNSYCPQIEVNPETYEVKADGELITCEPAKTLPLAQRYFMY